MAVGRAASSLRRLLAPDWRKNALFVALFAYAAPLARALLLPRLISVEEAGFPLAYFSYHVMNPRSAVFRPLSYALDAAFCYLVSCIAVYGLLGGRVRQRLADYVVDYATLGLAAAMLLARVYVITELGGAAIAVP